MKLRSPLGRPDVRRPFTGSRLRDILDERTKRAVALAGRLDLAAWTGPNGEPADPAPGIAAHFDVEIPTIAWDTQHVQIGATDDQRMRAVQSWIVEGDFALLTARPDSHLIGGPGVDFGLRAHSIVAVVEDWTLSAAQIERASAETERYFARYLGFITEQVERWRVTHSYRVRDAARERRALLEQITELEAVAP